MKAVLDLKDFCQKAFASDEKDYNDQFYRYNIVNDNNEVVAVVWFSQKVDSGNIYTVGVSIKDEKLREEFEIFVTCDLPQDKYYPSKFQMACWGKRLDTTNFYQYQEALNRGFVIGHTVMSIFELPEHLNPYKEARK